MTGTDWSEYLAAYHFDHPGITEDALGHAAHPELGTAYQWLASVVPQPCGAVVDLACGSCPMQDHLAYSSYLGIDRSESELAVATELGRGPTRVGDVTNVDLPDASADTVVMSMALMLVPVVPVLDEVARILRPGGTFAAILPAKGPLRGRDLLTIGALAATLRGPGSMPHHLTPGRLASALGGAGLTLKHVDQRRFPFRVVDRCDAELAVRSLYTPGRTQGQLRRAASWLAALSRLPGTVELPVPLLRVAAVRVA